MCEFQSSCICSPSLNTTTHRHIQHSQTSPPIYIFATIIHMYGYPFFQTLSTLSTLAKHITISTKYYIAHHSPCKATIQEATVQAKYEEGSTLMPVNHLSPSLTQRRQANFYVELPSIRAAQNGAVNQIGLDQICSLRGPNPVRSGPYL